MFKSLYLVFMVSLFVGCGYSTNNYAIVQEGTKDGVINQSGYVIVKPIYTHIFEFDGEQETFNHPHLVNLHWIHNKNSQAYAVVQDTNGKFGIINKQGKLLLKPIYNSVTYFFNGFLRVQVGDKFGLVDEDFNVVLKPTYDYISEFIDEIAILHQNNKYGCINTKLQLKVKPTYDKIYFQQEDFLRTKLHDKWGYLDNQCNVIAKSIYDYGYDFSNDIAKVVLDGKIGYLNKDGKLIAKPIFTQGSSSF